MKTDKVDSPADKPLATGKRLKESRTTKRWDTSNAFRGVPSRPMRKKAY